MLLEIIYIWCIYFFELIKKKIKTGDVYSHIGTIEIFLRCHFGAKIKTKEEDSTKYYW